MGKKVNSYDSKAHLPAGAGKLELLTVSICARARVSVVGLSET